MKAVILLSLFALAAAEDYYVTGHDDLDINAVVSDLKTLQGFVDCFLDRAPCSELTASFKRITSDAIKTACRRCSPVQKHLAKRFVQGVKTFLPQEYRNLRRHYDPENKYFDKFERQVLNY